MTDPGRGIRLLTVLICTVIGAVLVASIDAEWRLESETARLEHALRAAAERAEPEVALRKLFASLLASVRSGPGEKPRGTGDDRWDGGQGIPGLAGFSPGSIELWTFTADGRVDGRFRNGSDPARLCEFPPDADEEAAMTTAFTWIRGPWLGAYQVPLAVERKVAGVFRGTSWKQLIAGPNRVHFLYSTFRRIYGIWHFQSSAVVASAGACDAQPCPVVATTAAGAACQGAPGWRSGTGEAAETASLARSNGALLLVLENRIDERRLAELALQEVVAPGWRVGCIDRLCATASRDPVGSELLVERDRADQCVGLSSDPWASTTGRQIEVPALTSILLVGRVARPPIRWAEWLGLGVVLGLALAWSIEIDWRAFSGRLPIRALLAVLVALAGLVPFGLSLVFWCQFEANRTGEVIEAELRALEHLLIDLDRRFPAVFPAKAAWLAGWRRRLETALVTEPNPAMQPPIRLPYYTLVLPASGSPLDQVLTDTYAEELAGRFDTLFVIDRDGRLYREHSDAFLALRRLVDRPLPERLPLLQSLFERQGVIDLHALKRLVLYPGRYTLPELVAYKVYPQLHVQFLMSFSTALLAKYDAMHPVGGVIVDGAEQLVVNALLEEGEWTVVHEALQALGDFVSVGNDEMMLYLNPHVVRDGVGRPRFVATFVHQVNTFTSEYFRDLIKDGVSIPRDVEVAAVSWQRDSEVLPHPFVHRRFGRFRERLTGSRTMFSEVTRIDDQPRLLAGLAGRHLQGYQLFATRPLEVVDQRLTAVRRRFGLLALAMALVLGGMTARLWVGIVAPVDRLIRAVDAMQARQFGHRTGITTGDEFERVGAAFDRTLEGMAELEVARVVQESLLPAGPTVTATLSFTGSSRMCSTVGGDYFDARAHHDGSLDFILGDVSGHGVSAALVVAMAKALFSAMTVADRTPSSATVGGDSAKPLIDDVLKAMNDRFHSAIGRTKLMTCLAGTARPEGLLHLVNAGQCFPFLFTAPGVGGMVGQLASLPLGSRTRARLATTELSLPLGGRLVLYSDGLPEAVDPRGQPLGYDRVGEMCAAAWDPDPARHIAGILDRLRDFTGPGTWNDDVTIGILAREA